PRKKIASEKIQPSWVSFQSSGVDSLMPSSFVIGRLNTLNAYACPMHRCTQSAAGGTIHRLNPGPATVRERENHPPLSCVDISLDLLVLRYNRAGDYDKLSRLQRFRNTILTSLSTRTKKAAVSRGFFRDHRAVFQ